MTKEQRLDIVKEYISDVDSKDVLDSIEKKCRIIGEDVDVFLVGVQDGTIDANEIEWYNGEEEEPEREESGHPLDEPWDEQLAQKEQEDFAQDGDFENMEGHEIL